MPPSYRARNPWLRGLIALLLVADTATAACYYPNGTDRNAGFSKDIYTPINREDDCIKLCAGTSTDTHSTPGTGRQMDNDEKITPCSDGSYCCGDGAVGYTCCNDGRGVFLKDGTTQATNPSSTIASSSSSPTTAGVFASSTTDADSTLTPATSPPSPNVDGAAIAGIVIGGLAGILLLFLVFWFLLLKRRKGQEAARNGMVPQQGYPPTSQHTSYTDTKPQEAQGSYAGDYKRSELPAGPVSWTAGRSELDGEQQYFPIAKQLDSACLHHDRSDGQRQ
ncbi:MAG: hypothetical protein Q9180_006040 [Flavoplaca navasiana]